MKSEETSNNNTSTKNTQMKWYVVNVYSGHENKVAKLITQRMENTKMTNLLGEIVIPTQNKVVIAEGKRKTVQDRILPGYILIQMVLNSDTWPLIKDTQGVIGFTGMDKKPTPLSDTEVTAILKFMSVEQPAYQSSISIGDAVTITDGPFADFHGTVNRLDDQKGKVEVLINVFGRETPINVDLMQIKKL